MLHNLCAVCSQVIEGERLNALINVLNLPPTQWKCIKCVEAEGDKKTKGIYTGFSGASNLILSDNVGSQTGIAYVFPELNEENPGQDETELDNS